jgi:hypothetical protein
MKNKLEFTVSIDNDFNEEESYRFEVLCQNQKKIKTKWKLIKSEENILGLNQRI